MLKSKKIVNINGGETMGDCPLQGYTCDTCAYYGHCAPSKAEQNTREIIDLLNEVLRRLRR
jgi:hypothetical protein